MTFPSAQTGRTLSEALMVARNRAGYIKAMAQQAKTRMAAGSATSTDLLLWLDNFVAMKAELSTIAALPGLDTYAQAQLGTSVSADFTAMMTAIQNAGAWIVSNFPQTGGFILAESFNADGTRQSRSFTSAQTAGLQSLCDAIVAAIA